MTRRPRSLWLLASVLALASVAMSAAAPSTEPAPQSATGQEVTGLEVGATFHGFWGYESDAEAATALSLLKDAGGTWVRIDLGWAAVETGDGVNDRWALNRYDDAVDAAHRKGFNVLLVLQRTPSWANGSSDETLAPSDPEDFGDFASWISQRYAGKVQAIELWNEPNNTDFFRPRQPGQAAQEHAAMVKDAYTKIKGSERQTGDAVTVLAGSPSHVDVAWWDGMYAAGIRDYTDVVAVNPYPTPADLPPTTEGNGTRYRLSHLSELIELMRDNGDAGKPIWFCEFGWSSHSDRPVARPWERGVTEAQQADYFEQTIALVRTRYPQVEKVFWYNLSDRDDEDSPHATNFGLLTEDLAPKPVLARMDELFGR